MNYSMWLLIKWTETNRRFMMDSQLLPSSLEIPFFFYCKSAVSTVIRRKNITKKNKKSHVLLISLINSGFDYPTQGPTNMRTIVQSYSCVQARRTSVEFYPILELLIKKKNLKRYSHLKGRLGKDVDISLWNDTITNIISVIIINFTRRLNVFHEYINNFLICLVLNNKIISVKTFEASTLLYCHLFDFNEMIDNKPSLCFYSIYCKNCDGFSIYLTEWISYAIK
ncbi:unnamed protein product [Rhizophagus irregularis]|uniref:Uncharacterized protein n=1 Tax=Rhizophagus irregularis TaxID=588596 RepID=A0A916EL86_9GLOM|nr:unnamed protein product [Rhizophagus irregularis]